MKRILIVEDNLDEQMLIKRQLKKYAIDAELLIANDGQAAVDILSAHTKQELPTLVLLDLKMPYMNGHQVLKWIRGNEDTRLIPVIIFSSSDDKNDICTSYTLGANSYVHKKVECNKDLEFLSHYWMNLNMGPC